MAYSWEARRGTHKQLSWNDLAYDMQRAQTERSAADIVKCLRSLLERFEESEFIKYLVAPSPSSMAVFFQVSLPLVYQALVDLELQGYKTEYSSDYAPVILWDPLIREKTYRYSDGSENIQAFSGFEAPE